MATLILAILLTGSLPALLPKWQHVLLVAGAFFTALIVAFVYLLRDLDANPSSGDGPAFITLIILFGCAQGIVAASLVGRLIAQALARSLAPPTKRRAAKCLLILSLAPFALAGVLTSLHYAASELITLVAILFFPIFWLGLALQLAPNNSFKR